MKTIKIKNKQNNQLVGDLRGELEEKLLILCHGLADNKKNPVLEHLAETIAEEIMPTFIFDFTGTGESTGRFEDATYHQEIQDLETIMEYFKLLGVKEFFLLGHSMGGGVCQKTAGERQDIQGLITIGGVSYADSFKDKFPELVKQIEQTGKGYFMQEQFDKKFPITKKYLESAQTIKIEDAAKNVKCPVLAIHGADDTKIRLEQTKEWLNNIPHDNKELKIIKAMDHFFNKNQPQLFFEQAVNDVTEEVIMWLYERN